MLVVGRAGEWVIRSELGPAKRVGVGTSKAVAVGRA